MVLNPITWVIKRQGQHLFKDAGLVNIGLKFYKLEYFFNSIVFILEKIGARI